MVKRIETQEQKDKALKWMIEMAEHPLEPLKSDPILAEKYRITEKAVQDWNERTIPTLYEGNENFEETNEKQKEPTIEDDSWL